MFIFPGLGFGVSLCGADIVSDKMLYECAVTLGEALTVEEIERGQVFPSVSNIRHVSKCIAKAGIYVKKPWITQILFYPT